VKHLCIAIFFSFVTATAVNAQIVSEDALRQCSAKADPKERLECFDALAKASAVPQTDAPAKKHLLIYRTRHEARANCPDDQIVWASTSSRALYLPGNPHYGHTHGGYVCESAARASGYRGPTAHG
jgi:hypothetical protein